MIKKLVNVNKLDRRGNYSRYINHPYPIGVITSTIDVSKLVRLSQETKHKFNAMLCYCIAKAAYEIPECHYRIWKGQLYYYQKVSLTGILKGKNKTLPAVVWDFYPTFKEFESNYLKTNKKAIASGQSNWTSDDSVLIATSAIPNREIDSANISLDPQTTISILTWGKYRSDGSLPISYRFHHSLFDGIQIGDFFNNLQRKIDKFKI